MKKHAIGLIFMIAVVLMIGSANGLRGQNPGNPPNTNVDRFGRTPEQAAQIEQKRREQWADQNLDALRKVGEEANRGRITRRHLLSEKDRARIIGELEEKALAEEAIKLMPAETYFARFAEFLKDKKTGLIRLFPDMKCDQGMTVDVRELERCAEFLKIRGGGSFYSFRNKTNLNETGAWDDIHFIDDRLEVGGLDEFGLIKEIGDVDLETLTSKSAEIESLLKYKPKKRRSEVKLEKQQLEKGLIDGFSSRVPAKSGSTYILRSVAYRRKIFDSLDHRADIVVAFRVIGRETDGSLILLWKELKRRNAQTLKEK
ncbi:MAG: hypothetical protein R2747_23470 [Pyrinomonadaceae bacterium]